MKSNEWHWTSSDAQPMYARSWEPEGNARGCIVLIHGLGEHIGRYEHVGQALTQAGFVLSGYDLRGHGKSGGARGHIPSYDALMNDIEHFLDLTTKRYPGLPRFLYGHSMGGNQVINFALRRQAELKGIIATGPWLKLAFEPPAIKVALGKMMNNLMPAFIQASGLDTKALSHDINVVQTYENDPLVHDKISARLFVEMYQTGLWALEHANKFPLPLLLMHGSEDRLTSSEASRQFAASAGEKVTLRIWDGLFHEIHNEAEKVEVFATMTGWLDAQLKTK
ncbi:MAG: alpha/beta hydrolase [Anaerolineales bacterium]